MLLTRWKLILFLFFGLIGLAFLVDGTRMLLGFTSIDETPQLGGILVVLFSLPWFWSAYFCLAMYLQETEIRKRFGPKEYNKFMSEHPERRILMFPRRKRRSAPKGQK